MGNKKRKSSKLLVLMPFAVIAAAVVLIFSVIMFRYSKISSLNYKLIDMNEQIDELDNEIKFLNIKLDSLSSSKTMEEKALSQGMIFPDKTDKVYLAVE